MMYSLLLVITVILSHATPLVAQGMQLAPTWELHLATASNIRHHASADLISIQVGDSLTFYDVWTGDSVTTRLKQGECCFVDRSRTLILWIDPRFPMTGRATLFSNDSVMLVSSFHNVSELNVYGFAAMSSSADERVFIAGWGGSVVEAEDHGLVAGGSIGADISEWGEGDGARSQKLMVSRSGRLYGGVDSAPHPSLGPLFRPGDIIVFSSPRLYSSIPLKQQSFAWLDDINNILIASDGLFNLNSGSTVFLRPLPKGWNWHAPFASWTYALACKSDSSQVSIVSLVTDSVVAQCVPTSGRIDTIYSDVQLPYVLTYDATARVLSGFVVDEALIPQQVISSVADGRTASVEEAAHGALWPNPSAGDVVHVRTPLNTSYITITSAHGIQKWFPVLPGTEVIDVSLHDFSSGLYVFTLVGADMSQSHLVSVVR